MNILCYYAEDRSAGQMGAGANPKNLRGLHELLELTDWSEKDLYEIVKLTIGEEYTTRDGIYVKRVSPTKG